MTTPDKKPAHIGQLTQEEQAKVGTMESPLLGPWVDPFLEMLRKVGVVSVACKHAKIERSTAYDLRDNDPHFAKLWADAIEESVDLLEATARNRAMNGTKTPVVNKGKLVTDAAGQVVYQVKNSDALTIFLLKKYRYPDQVVHTGPGGGPIKHEHRLVPDNKNRVMSGVAKIIGAKALPPPRGVEIDIDATIVASGGRDDDEGRALAEEGESSDE